MKAYVLCGISASGKSTFAKEMESQGYMDINRDDIRFKLFCNGVRDWNLYKFTKERENRVTREQEVATDGAWMLGMNVIISDTNINDKTRNFWINRLTDLGYDVEVKYFDIDLMEALQRDAKRPNGVGYKVITDQYARYMKLRHGDSYHKHQQGLKHCVICDIDGSIADMTGVRTAFEWYKVHLDKPRQHVIDMVTNYRFDSGNYVIFYVWS
jgi:predicted kinase